LKNTNKLKRCGKEFTREKAKKEIDLTLKIAKKCHGKIDEIPTSFQISLSRVALWLHRKQTSILL